MHSDLYNIYRQRTSQYFLVSAVAALIRILLLMLIGFGIRAVLGHSSLWFRVAFIAYTWLEMAVLLTRYPVITHWLELRLHFYEKKRIERKKAYLEKTRYYDKKDE